MSSRLASPGPLSPPRPLSPRVLLVGLLAWAVAATALAAAELITFERAYLVPVLILGTTATLVTVYLRSAPLRAALERVDLRILVGWHVVRTPIGVGFLLMHARGELPELFATRAGWGDIAAGLGALAVVLLISADGVVARRTTLAWNLLALGDILLVVGTAQYLVLVLRDPLMFTLMRLPWGLLPTFVVPLVISTHLVVFARVRALARAEQHRAFVEPDS